MLEDLGDGDGADGIAQEASKQLKTLNDWLCCVGCVIWFSGVLVSCSFTIKGEGVQGVTRLSQRAFPFP